jgi:hypothetical protein
MKYKELVIAMHLKALYISSSFLFNTMLIKTKTKTINAEKKNRFRKTWN